MTIDPATAARPLPVATSMRIVPCDLAEGEFVRAVGDAFFLRTLDADLSAGTLRIAMEPRRHGGVIFWRVPAVPLPELIPLVRAVAPLVDQALPGISLTCGFNVETGQQDNFVHMTYAAQDTLLQAGALVGRFWRRWTGRTCPSQHFARCARCDQLIVAPPRPYDTSWQTEPDQNHLIDLYCPDGPPSDEGDGIIHRPYPDGHPFGVHVDFRPDHHPAYTQATDGTWTCTCDCGRFRGRSVGPNGRDLVIEWHLHAGQLPPGAPFDLED